MDRTRRALALGMGLALSGCGGGGSSTPTSANDESSSAVVPPSPPLPTEPARIGDAGSGNARVLQLLSNRQGQVLAVWMRSGHLYAAVGDSRTGAWATPRLMAEGVGSRVDVATDGEGFVLTWFGYVESSLGVRLHADVYQRGRWLGAQVIDVRDAGSEVFSLRGPQLAGGALGYAVVWQYNERTATGDEGRVVAQRFDAAGWSGPTPLQAVGELMEDAEPQVAARAGGFAVAWLQRRTQGQTFVGVVHACLFDAGAWRAGEALSSGPSAQAPQLASNGESFALAWSEDRFAPNPSTSVNRCVLARVWTVGSGWSDAVQINVDSSRVEAGSQRLASNGSDYLLVWLQGPQIVGGVSVGLYRTVRASVFTNGQWTLNPPALDEVPEPSLLTVVGGAKGYALMWRNTPSGQYARHEQFVALHDGRAASVPTVRPVTRNADVATPQLVASGEGFAVAWLERGATGRVPTWARLGEATLTSEPLGTAGWSSNSICLTGHASGYSALFAQVSSGRFDDYAQPYGQRLPG